MTNNTDSSASNSGNTPGNTPVSGELSASIPVPRQVPASHGMSWITAGFALFRRSPWVWIAITLVAVVSASLLSLIPAGTLVVSLVTPVITAGIMLGCRALDEGQPLEVAHLFAGFQQRTGALIMSGLLYLALLLGILLLVGLISLVIGVQMPDSSVDVEELPVIDPLFLLLLLVSLALIAPVAMAYYFAAALIVFHHQLGVVGAFRLSFRGCLQNVSPFLVYGLLILMLGLLALLPLMLGILVLMPIIFASTYVAYKDIFLGKEP